MLHLSPETYNNEQVSKVLDRISAKTCLKWIVLVVNPSKSPFRLND